MSDILAAPAASLAVARGFIVALFGLCIGSFSNVLIDRLPKRQSIAKPGSHCADCRHPLGVGDLIPVLSYLLLGGRCRYCRGKIPRRYPLVEGLTALLFIGCYLRFGWLLALIASAALCAIALCCALIDIDHMLVMDELIIAGGLCALVFNGFLGALCGGLDMLIGVAAGALPLLLVGWAARGVSGKKALGGGDIKFIGMVGAFLGWKGALMTLFFASVGGGLALAVPLALGRIQRGQAIPFVPILAGGAGAALFFGQALLGWYFGLF